MDEEGYINPESVTIATKDSKHIILYKRRYLVLIILSLALFANGEAWMTYGSVMEQSMLHFDKDDSAILKLGSVFLITFTIQAIPCTFMPQLIGLKWTIVTGCALNFGGALFRLISLLISHDNRLTNYAIAMTGNVLFGFAQGFILNIPALASDVWFGDSERSVSTSFAYMANAVGVGIGFLDIFLLMNNTTDLEKIHRSFLHVTIFQISLSTLVFILSLIVVKEKPPTPPSCSQFHKKENFQAFNLSKNMLEMVKTIGRLLSNKTSLLLLYVFSSNYGCYVSIFLFLSGIVDKYVQSPIKLTGYIGAIGIIAGGVNTAFIGYVMNKTENRQNQKIGLSINLICAIPFILIIIIISLNKLENIGAMILFILFLTFCPAYIAIGCEILADATYPIDPNISSNAALIFGNIVGAVMSYTIDLAHINIKYYLALGIALAMYISNILILSLLKYKKRRLDINIEGACLRRKDS